ncbi:hypothetical protein [Catellatospora sp. NPDC049609]|uniref:WD40 repeat domain-containing protein n=1 Tax=Catellatospora sp. NPDC049609 TaxID=3155505 RepID=UPI00343E50E3
MSLREHLRAVAEAEPAPALPSDLYTRARGRARRRRLAAAALVAVAATGAGLTALAGTPVTPEPAAPELSDLVGAGVGGAFGWLLLAVLLAVLAVLWRDLPGGSLARRLVAVAAAGALLVLAAPPGVALWGEPRGRVGLPDRLATSQSWWLASEARVSPPGPVALVFGGPAVRGELEEGRVVLLAADGDRYRVLDVFSDPLERAPQSDEQPIGGTWPVLSPDGRLLTAGYGMFDLVTGRQAGDVAAPPAGWSGDGKRVALPVYDPMDSHQTGWEVWDLPSGRMLRAIPYEHSLSGGTVALSPDGSRIAVEQGHNVVVYPTEGGGAAVTWPREGWRLGDSTAWSPDGRRLAMVRRGACVGCAPTSRPTEVRIVDVDTWTTAGGGSFAPLPPDVALRVQGWRTPQQLVVQVGGAVEVFTLGVATPSRLLTLPPGVTEIEIATSRLADPLRPAEPPTYGPPNLFLWLVVGTCGVPLLALAALVWWLLRQARRWQGDGENADQGGASGGDQDGFAEQAPDEDQS